MEEHYERVARILDSKPKKIPIFGGQHRDFLVSLPAAT